MPPENLPAVRLEAWYTMQCLLSKDPDLMKNSRLSRKQYYALAVFYHLPPFERGDVSTDQFAAQAGVTRQAVHQLKNKALAKLGLLI